MRKHQVLRQIIIIILILRTLYRLVINDNKNLLCKYLIKHVLTYIKSLKNVYPISVINVSMV